MRLVQQVSVPEAHHQENHAAGILIIAENFKNLLSVTGWIIPHRRRKRQTFSHETATSLFGAERCRTRIGLELSQPENRIKKPNSPESEMRNTYYLKTGVFAPKEKKMFGKLKRSYKKRQTYCNYNNLNIQSSETRQKSLFNNQNNKIPEKKFVFPLPSNINIRSKSWATNS